VEPEKLEKHIVSKNNYFVLEIILFLHNNIITYIYSSVRLHSELVNTFHFLHINNKINISIREQTQN